MLSEIARAEARLKLVLNEAKNRDIAFTEGSCQTIDRVAKVESEIKTIYKWMVGSGSPLNGTLLTHTL